MMMFQLFQKYKYKQQTRFLKILIELIFKKIINILKSWMLKKKYCLKEEKRTSVKLYRYFIKNKVKMTAAAIIATILIDITNLGLRFNLNGLIKNKIMTEVLHPSNIPARTSPKK